MKNMKKIASVVLALVMVMAMMVPAFAANDGSITITNAAKGETYKVVKLFDMTFDSTKDAYSYSLPAGMNAIPAGLTEYFEADKDGYVTVKAGATNADGTLISAAVDEIAKWAKNQPATAEGKATGDVLVFNNLAYGYYVVISRSEGTSEDGDDAKITRGAISVTSTNPNATIVDKNDSEPHFPDGMGKTVDDHVVEVGGTVKYTVKYITVNWTKPQGSNDQEQVISYTIEDTLPSFLTNVVVTSIEVGDTTIYTKADGDITDADEPYQFGEDKTIVLDWAKKELDCDNEEHTEETDHTDGCYKWVSLYNNGAELVITYTATVTEDILNTDNDPENAETFNHTNKVTITPKTTKGNGTPDDDETDIYSATIVIDKYEKSNESKKLAGAKFVLKKIESETTGDDGEKVITYSYYKWVAATDTEKAHVEWVDSQDAATVAETDKDGKAEDFKGLDFGTYYLEEIEAPAGYNKIAGDKTIVIGKNADGSDINDATVIANIHQTEGVENSTGSLLPSTGGIGTTIFYIVGGVLVVAAAILLITRKRMSDQ